MSALSAFYRSIFMNGMTDGVKLGNDLQCRSVHVYFRILASLYALIGAGRTVYDPGGCWRDSSDRLFTYMWGNDIVVWCAT